MPVLGLGLVLGLVFGVSGCAGGPATSAETMPLVGSTNVIHVVPVAGLDRPLRMVLADAVAASLRDMERPALLTSGPNDRGPTVRGRIEKLRERGSIVWVSSEWQLLAPYGTAVAERKREVVIDKNLWDRQSVEVVNLLLRESIPAIAEMVADYVGPLNATEVADTPAAADLGVSARAKSPATPDLEVSARPKKDSKPAAPMPTTMELRRVAAATNDTGSPPKGAAGAAGRETDAVAKPETPASEAAAPQPAKRPPMTLTAKTSGAAKEPAAPDSKPGPAPTMAASDEPLPTDATTFDVRTRQLASGTPAAETAMAQPAPASEDKIGPPSQKTAPSEMMATADPRSVESKTLEQGISMPTPDSPVRWGRPSFLIRPVTGAPGDGNIALTEAIKAALRSRDLTITEDPRQAGYEVVGNVDIGLAVNGRQRAKVVWTVNTIGGDEVGKAIQENIIAAGSLDGPWGRVAETVSVAAADGIQELFDAPRRKTTAVGYVPKFPKIPKLPRMPGRALPPASD